jgi:hypothetical protein
MVEYLMIALGILMILAVTLVVFQWVSKLFWKKKKQALDNINASISQSSVLHEKQESRQMPDSSTPELKLISSNYHNVAHAWRHERVHTFYQKHIAPYQKILEATGYLKPATALLTLLDQHGDCPSVVKITQDHEYQSLQNVYDLLSKITLLDHCLNVAEQMIVEVAKAKTKDPEMIMGKIMVTALGHDIGKIPDLIDTDSYRKGDHPYISYLVLKKAIFTENSPQHEDILNAVKSHHYPIREGFTHDLRKADQAAREMEAEKLSLQGESITDLVKTIHEQQVESQPLEQNKGSKEKGASPQTIDLSWMDLDEFLSLIEPEINRVENESYFKAFSMNNGLVYLMLSLVSDTVIEMAKCHNHNEVLINIDSTEKKRSLEFTVKTMLAEKGLIPSFIGKGFSGARFGLIDGVGKKKMVGIYMPVEARAFKISLSELEDRKNKFPVIKRIAEVRPLVGQKK